MGPIGFWEIFLLFIVGLLILGPERLPRVASQIGRWVGRARRTANQLRYQLEREIALADIEKAAQGKQSKPNQSESRQSGDSASAAADSAAAGADVSGAAATDAGVASEAAPVAPDHAAADTDSSAADPGGGDKSAGDDVKQA